MTQLAGAQTRLVHQNLPFSWRPALRRINPDASNFASLSCNNMAFIQYQMYIQLTDQLSQAFRDRSELSRMPTNSDFVCSDPLQQLGYEDESSPLSESEDDPSQEVSTAQVENRSGVLHWSVEQVMVWVQENIPFSHDRMQECLHAFQTRGVDGLALLTLQRSHRACLGMTDFEWMIFKASRRRLLSGCEKVELQSSDKSDWKSSSLSSYSWTPPCTPNKQCSEYSSPPSPRSLRSNSSAELRRVQGGALVHLSPNSLFGFPKLPWSTVSAKDEQIELLVTEVQSLRGEVVSAEERETTLQAQLHHVDNVLRTAFLSGYLYTRTRWIPLLGEPVIESADVDDWLQRFLVLEGSSIFFYLRATDLRPQGTILLDDITDAGPLPPHTLYRDSQQWFMFYISTCHGLRLEACTPWKFQMDSWLRLIGVDPELEN